MPLPTTQPQRVALAAARVVVPRVVVVVVRAAVRVALVAAQPRPLPAIPSSVEG